MLEYDRIGISEGNDISKTNASKECHICHYWHFKDICNVCHGLIQKAVNFNNVVIVFVKGNAYRIHYWYMSKDNAISIMNNSHLNDKMSVLRFFLLYIKMNNTTYYQRNRDVILNRVKDYYENNKKELRELARYK